MSSTPILDFEQFRKDKASAHREELIRDLYFERKDYERLFRDHQRLRKVLAEFHFALSNAPQG